MRVLVMFTGGTIGCLPPDSHSVLNVADVEGANWTNYHLLVSYKRSSLSAYKDDVTFDVINPLNVLSENMTVSMWQIITEALQKVDFSQYDGVVITHGTDTLAYTASYLGIALSGIDLPVVLVSSNKNLYHPYANGHQNFESALDFIRNSKCVGVYVAYSYDRDKTIIYMGTRIKQSCAYIDRYESVDGVDFGFVKYGRFTKTCDIYPVCGEWILDKIVSLEHGVLLVHPYVGLDYSTVLLDNEKYKAVLHTVYHSFTLCTGDQYDSTSVLYFSKKCSDAGIPLYIAPYSEELLKGGERYNSTNELLREPVNFLCGHSVEYAYAKLLLAVNLYPEAYQKKKFLAESY